MKLNHITRMTGSSYKLKGASISDIHLGHSRNPTTRILRNLEVAFPDTAETGELDIIFIAGDVFDDLLSSNNECVYDIDLWIGDFLRMCKKRNIKVRVLYGTPSHDWQQGQRFTHINEIAQIGCDVQYVPNLSIEYIEDLDINVLYVPDEWSPSTEKTYEEVLALMRAKGLSKVDFAIMHGQFEYQLPEIVKAPKHNSSLYLEIVKYLIFIGHVHVYSFLDRIIAQGSFDRISHGEERPKGHVRFGITHDDQCEAVFVENKDALIFKTIRCMGMSLEETLAEIDKVAITVPTGSHLRVESDDTNPIFANMELLIRQYPLITWTKKPISVSETEIDSSTPLEEELDYTPITITPENLKTLLMSRIANLGVSAEIMECAAHLLDETTG